MSSKGAATKFCLGGRIHGQWDAQTHLPQNLVSPRISATLFENVGKCKILMRVKKKFLKYQLGIGGSPPLILDWGTRPPSPAFGAHDKQGLAARTTPNI